MTCPSNGLQHEMLIAEPPHLAAWGESESRAAKGGEEITRKKKKKRWRGCGGEGWDGGGGDDSEGHRVERSSHSRHSSPHVRFDFLTLSNSCLPKRINRPRAARGNFKVQQRNNRRTNENECPSWSQSAGGGVNAAMHDPKIRFF